MSRRRKTDQASSKPSRWEVSARKENLRRIADAPLFAHAGILPMVTAEDRQVAVEKGVRSFVQRIATGEEVNAARAGELRSQIVARVDAVELERLDRQRLIYPRTSVYAIEFWREELTKLDGPPTLAPQEEPRELGPTCGECSWIRGCGAMHPPNCAGLRALIYGLGRCEQCADRSRCGGCPEHVAEVKAVDAGERVPEAPAIFPPRS